NGWIRLKGDKGDPKTQKHTQSESYEAKGLDEFKEKHAEVYERYKDSGVFNDIPSSRQGFRVIEPQREPAFEDCSAPKLGVTLGAVPDAVRAHVDVPEKAVIVESVLAGTPAEKMGLQLHDIITHVNGIEVATVEDVRLTVKAASEKGDVKV